MAIGWLTVLQNVPWAEVIRNAPRVAEGAKKLWNTAARKRAAPEAPAATPEAAAIAALEATVADLHEQMLASSELIKALAEQNAQLIARAEANRRRLAWVGVIAVAAAVAAAAGLVLAIIR